MRWTRLVGSQEAHLLALTGDQSCFGHPLFAAFRATWAISPHFILFTLHHGEIYLQFLLNQSELDFIYNLISIDLTQVKSRLINVHFILFSFHSPFFYRISHKKLFGYLSSHCVWMTPHFMFCNHHDLCKKFNKPMWHCLAFTFERILLCMHFTKLFLFMVK